MGDIAALGPSALAPLESLGRALAARLVPLNLWTGALLAAALLVDRALARRARPAWRIALYAPVALRALLPLGWHLPLPLGHTPRLGLALLGPASPVDAGALEVAGPHAGVAYACGAVLYGAVVALLAARAVAARHRLGRALASARPLRGPRFSAPWPILEHHDLGPLVVGLRAPRIVLPRRLLAAGDEHALSCALRHEAAHLRRGDPWLALAAELLTIALWPVIPLRAAAARVRELIEMACDEAALTGADAPARARYGHALLDLAEQRSFVVAPLRGGELHFGSPLRARIEALASGRPWPPSAQGLVLSLAVAALLVACSGAAPGPGTTSEATASQAHDLAKDPAQAGRATASSARDAGRCDPSNNPVVIPPDTPGGEVKRLYRLECL